MTKDKLKKLEETIKVLEELTDKSEYWKPNNYKAIRSAISILKAVADVEGILTTMSEVDIFHNHQEHPMPDRYWVFIATALQAHLLQGKSDD